LKEDSVNVSDLFLWQIPVDIVDIYSAFLKGTILDNQVQYICNCSSSTTFGRYCEYSFEEGIGTIEDLFNSSSNGKKTLYPVKRLLPCYDLINNKERCIDYRDICDGEWDTKSGEDELHCELIEINTCADHEFRCRTGLCIDREFLFDGQADCPDLSDEQRNLLFERYGDFRHCYEQATFDCDERWCGREWLSCGDGECIAWNRRFWNGFDCSNSYTHVYNCELEERHGKSIEFCLTDDNGRCQPNIIESNTIDDRCRTVIKCALTLHPTCTTLGMLFKTYEKAISQIHILCQNRTQIVYASGIHFLSPFIRAHYTIRQFQTSNSDFFALMKMRQPGQFCLVGEYTCQGVKIDTIVRSMVSDRQQSCAIFSVNISRFRFCCQLHSHLTFLFAGDGWSQCPNGTDEMSLSVNWQQKKCRQPEDLACSILRGLYDTDNEKQSTYILPFASLCDSIWDLRNGSDETDCEEWVCEDGWIKQYTKNSRWSGNCINPQWKCNHAWDYADGSDEFHCNGTDKYPVPECLLLATGQRIRLNESNEIAGNGKVECSGGIDERVTFACTEGFPLNERFLCNDQAKCLPPKLLCDHVPDCSEGEDESEFWCGAGFPSMTNTCAARTFACQERNDSGPCIPNENRCNTGNIDCQISSRDEMMCIKARDEPPIKSRPFMLPTLPRTFHTGISPWYCDRVVSDVGFPLSSINDKVTC
ncbi:unnamed protein product, partial [Rotaria sp. Silwood2]